MHVLPEPPASVLTVPNFTSHLPSPEPRAPAAVTVSIVSHEHDLLIAKLVAQLCDVHGGLIAHVVLTHNLRAEAVPTPANGWPFVGAQGSGAGGMGAFGSASWLCTLAEDRQGRSDRHVDGCRDVV